MSLSNHFSSRFGALNLRICKAIKQENFILATTTCLRIEWYRKEAQLLFSEGQGKVTCIVVVIVALCQRWHQHPGQRRDLPWRVVLSS
ncbi:hypothetical protein AAC387_Pa02g1575 [Persea americana]